MKLEDLFRVSTIFDGVLFSKFGFRGALCIRYVVAITDLEISHTEVVRDIIN